MKRNLLVLLLILWIFILLIYLNISYSLEKTPSKKSQKIYYYLSFYLKRDKFFQGEYPLIYFGNCKLELNDLWWRNKWHHCEFFLRNKGNGEFPEVEFSFPKRGVFSVKEIKVIPFQIHLKYPPEGKVFINEKIKFVWEFPVNYRLLEVKIELSKSRDFKKSKVIHYNNVFLNYYELPYSLPEGKWFWRVKVFQYKNLLAVSDIKNFYVRGEKGKDFSEIDEVRIKERPENLDFYPIGIYSPTIESFNELKKAGFNAVQTYRTEADYLKQFIVEAEKNNLKVLIKLPEKNRAQLLNFAQKYQSTILGWYLEDEPEGRSVSPKIIWSKKKYLIDNGFHQLGAIALLRAWRAIDYAPAVDVLMIDPYPVPQKELTWISDSLDEAYKTIKNDRNKRVWSVIQAFNWSFFSNYIRYKGIGRFPSYEEQRAMTYLAIVHQVRGIFYWTFQTKNYCIKDYPEYWQGLKNIITELRSIFPVVTAAPVPKDLRIDDGFHSIFKKVKEKDLKNNQYLNFKKRVIDSSGNYLIVVNAQNKTEKLEVKEKDLIFSDLEKPVRMVEIFERREIKKTGRKFIDWFEPYQVKIYKITSKSEFITSE
ncbi:MAG: hypothetical protein ACE5WD_06300 [Candidatus Aminicenantia bacterium]